MTEPVVVIGASSAGLLTAELLASRGVPVRVYEQSERLAPAARSLIVTPAIGQALGFVPTEAVINRVTRFELRSNGTLANVMLEDADLIIERSTLIRLLADRASRAGAQLHFGWRFKGFAPGRQGTDVLLSRPGRDGTEQVAARFVVGADGAQSAVARALGRPSQGQVSVVQARVRQPPGVDPCAAKVWFLPRETPYFYWLIPESPTTAAIGIADDDAGQARPKLDGFLSRLGYEAFAYQAARIAMYGPGSSPGARMGGAEVLLVGDAAGQVKVTTVGGTVTGLWGARAAADAITRASPYRQELRRVNRELHLHWWIRRLLNRFREEDYSALLRALNRRVHRILGERNRDVMAGALWSLIAAQPRLLLLAARARAGP